jgi:hypothetical protein
MSADKMWGCGIGRNCKEGNKGKNGFFNQYLAPIFQDIFFSKIEKLYELVSDCFWGE